MVDSSDLAELADRYGFTEVPTIADVASPGINNLVVEVRMGRAEYILKIYRAHADPSALHYEHRLLLWLHTHTLPFAVPAPLVTVDGETMWQGREGTAALFPKLEGAPPSPATSGQLERLGAALAQLHTVLAAYPATPRPHLKGFGALEDVHACVPEPSRLDAPALRQPDEPALAQQLAWWRDEVTRLQEFVTQVYTDLPSQVIHGDYGPANTLFAGEELMAVLDFDLALPDKRAIDFASGLELSMRTWENPMPWRQVEAFCRGYRAHAQLTDAEVQALPDLMTLRDVVSTIWWLGRGLAEGHVERHLWRLGSTQEAQQWRVKHGDQLVDQVAQWML